MTTERTCSVEGCDREVASRGMCNAHYIRVRKYGNPHKGGPLITRQYRDHCRVDGCVRPVRGQGMCNAHYLRHRRNGSPGDSPVRLHVYGADEALEVKTAPEGDCLVWIASDNGNGYGQIRVDGKYIYVHRYAYEREHGPIPDGLVVRHKCDNRRCVKLDHLELGTHQDNMNDMIARGRAHWQKGRSAS